MEQENIPSDATQGRGGNGAKSQDVVVDIRGDMLKEFIKVVHDVMPVLDQMKSSIEESSHAIPRASLQLSSVTQATENATVEILNVLDSMTRRFSSFETLVTQIEDRNLRLQTLGAQITGHMDNLLAQQPHADGLVGMRTLWAEYLEKSSNPEIVDRARTSLAEAQSEAMSIAMTLQVQDITSQQIAGVINLIESVRAQLRRVLGNLERDGDAEGGCDGGLVVQPRDDRNEAFNSDATYSRDPERQEMADDIISEWNNASRRKTE